MADSRIQIRRGGDGDVRVVLAMLDSAIAWMVERGATGQWGSTPASRNPRFVDRAHAFANGGGLHIATIDARPAGALCAGDANEYVPVAAEPELYVQLLVTDRAYAGLGVGARLLEHARDLARERRVGLLRVDCYAGNDGDLVAYYEKQGFTRAETFTVERPSGPWPGQILTQRLDDQGGLAPMSLK